MKLRKQIASGVLALFVASSAAIPALAAEGNQEDYYTKNIMKPVYNNQGQVAGHTRSLPNDNILTKAKADLQLSESTYAINSATADVTGDQVADTVLLAGIKDKPQDIYTKELKLLVYDGQTKKFSSLDLHMGGYEGTVFLGDFTGDKVNDVLVAAPTGGSGGIVNHVIVTFAGESPAIIFSGKQNNGAKMTGKLIDGFKAVLVNENTGRSIELDLGLKKEQYVREKIYDETGKLLKAVNPISYPYGLLEPVDLNRDGIYELRGAQRVIGAYGADSIARVDSVWQYKDSDWQPKEIRVSSFLVSPNETTVKPAAKEYTVTKKALQSDSVEVYYPQLENMDSILTMGYVNQVLEKAAEKYGKWTNPGGKLQVDYEVVRQDPYIFSVVFRGSQPFEGGQQKILTGISIDLRQRRVIDVQELFQEDPSSQAAISTLLQTAAQGNRLVNKPPVLGDWMGMYLTGSEVVLYYLENDHAKDYVRLAIPLEKAKPYLKAPYQSISSRNSIQ